MQSYSAIRWCLLFFLVIVATSSELLGGDNKVESFRILAGTLEPIALPGRGYIFRSTMGEEEIFDLSTEAFLRNKGVNPPRMPGLREIGFKLDNAVQYLYETAAGFRSEVVTAQAAAAEHPSSKVVARLFGGEAGSRLEIAVTGQTPVFRTDLKIGGRDITLWANRKADLPAK